MRADKIRNMKTYKRFDDQTPRNAIQDRLIRHELEPEQYIMINKYILSQLNYTCNYIPY